MLFPIRRKPLAATLLVIFAVSTALIVHAAPGDLERLHQTFLKPPDDARIMMRWWWFGSAVAKPELEREMRVMKEGGIGGFEIQPVYPVELDDPEKGFINLPYLSDGYIDALKFTAQKARELGMRMDVTLGSGWPFGGPHTPVTEAAGALRCDRIEVAPGTTYVKKPSLANGEKMMATFFAPGDRRQFSSDGLQKIGDGADFTLPTGWSGPHVVMFFISSRSGMQVKRPAVGAEGFVLDHMNRDAIEHHLNVVGTRLMTAFGPNPPYSVFSDSLEVASDWTPDLITEFRKRRGYDLTPYLPALVGDMGEKTGSVRRDWGKTMTELVEERYLMPINEWAHQHHTKFRSQTYGTPPVSLSSNALVDLPEGEHGPAWRQFSDARWASSASHLYGRNVTSSETWTWLHSPAFRATPLDMKAEADLHFVQGINQFVGHGWAYSPASAGEPGWRFYAAAVFNEHNPWWIVMPDAARYFQRVSWLMRQGKPANDIAIYLPTNDAYAAFRPNQDSVDRSMERMIGTTLVPQVSTRAITSISSTTGQSTRWEFRYAGADSAGRGTHSAGDAAEDRSLRRERRNRHRHEASAVNGNGSAGCRRYAADQRVAAAMKAHLVTDEKETRQDAHRSVPPDFFAGDPAIGFNHRKLDSADVYFVANTSNHPVHIKAAIRQKDSPARMVGSVYGQGFLRIPGQSGIQFRAL